MKSVWLALFLGLASLPAWAGVGDSAGGGRAGLTAEWRELVEMDRHLEVDIRWPVAQGYPVNTLCYTNASLETVTEVEVCTKWKNVTRRGNAYDGLRMECVAKEVRKVNIPWDTRQAPTFDVDIYGKASGHNRERKLLDRKRFDLPACEPAN